MRFVDLVAAADLGTGVRRATRGTTIALLKMGNLGWGELQLDNVEAVDRDRVPGGDALRLRRGDLLFNTRNTPDLVGKTAVWRDELPEATYDNNLLRVRFVAGVSSMFVCLWMSNGVGRARVRLLSAATTSVAAIYWGSLAQYLLPVPSFAEQERIVAYIDEQDEALRTQQEQAVKASHLASGLAADLLTGRVRLPESLIAELAPAA
jgi:type I restriction enzyme S subunit